MDDTSAQPIKSRKINMFVHPDSTVWIQMIAQRMRRRCSQSMFACRSADPSRPHVVFWLSSASALANGQVYELEQFPLIGRYIAPIPE
jgi:hypothetical protein